MCLGTLASSEQYEGSSIYSLVFLLWIAESRSVPLTAFPHGLSNYMSGEITFSAD